MLNVFLDSNIIYNDPFMESGINKRLLNKIKQVNGKIYITDIVYKEVINNYVVKLKDLNLELEKLKRKLDTTNINIAINLIDVENEEKKLKLRLDNLIKDNSLNLLSTDNNLLDEVVYRAIKRIKPFSNNKEEFRDCLIWLTYAKKVESEIMENCFFITNNVNDFFSNDKINLHPDLINDTKRFRIYKGLIDFFINEQDLFDLGNLKTLKEIFNFKSADLYSNEISEKFKYAIIAYIDSNNNLLSKYIFDLQQSSSINLESYDITKETITSTDLDINKKTIDITGNFQIYIELSTNINNENQITVVQADIKFYCVKKVNINIEKDEYILEDGFLEFDLEVEDFDKLDSNEVDDYMYEKYYDGIDLVEAERMDALENYYMH